MENRRGEVSEHEAGVRARGRPFSPALAPWLRGEQTAARSRLSRRLRALSRLGDADPGCRLRAWFARVLSARTRLPPTAPRARCRCAENPAGKRRRRGRLSGCRSAPSGRQGPIPVFSGNIALLDVLHYLPLSEQTALLSHLAQCVAPGGLLVIRDCPRDNSPRFWMTCAAEKFAQAISWNWNTSLHFPSRERITAAFNGDEFERESRPLWGQRRSTIIFLCSAEVIVRVPKPKSQVPNPKEYPGSNPNSRTQRQSRPSRNSFFLDLDFRSLPGFWSLGFGFPQRARPELFRPRNHTLIAPLRQSAQGQLQAPWIEFRIFRHAMSFMQKNDGAGFGPSQDSLGHQCWLALHGIQSAHRPADQGQSASRQFGMHKQILQTGRRPE